MANKYEIDGEILNLGLERLKELMNDDEVFVSNAPDKSVALTPHWNAQDLAERLEKTGRYKSVRIIDKAFDINGEELLGYKAVVIRAKLDK